MLLILNGLIGSLSMKTGYWEVGGGMSPAVLAVQAGRDQQGSNFALQ
jgi:hypothetical protein